METTNYPKTFQNLIDLSEDGGEGLVILGAGGDLNEWVEGITKNLFEEKIIPENNQNWIKEAFTLFGNVEGENGRTDLVMIFNPEVKIEIGRMAIWRLQTGYMSWVSDFVVNYRSDYGVNNIEGEGEEDEDNLY